MTDAALHRLVCQFRFAIDAAKQSHSFHDDLCFNRFPNACCGDTCYLLAEYLQSKGVKTIYVCGDDRGQSHAWLVVRDHRITIPQPQFWTPPNEILSILNEYSNNAYVNPIDVTHYTEPDIINGLIIDITADQFGYVPVYVDYIGSFHKQFIFDSAYDYDSLGTPRLRRIYKTIIAHLWRDDY